MNCKTEEELYEIFIYFTLFSLIFLLISYIIIQRERLCGISSQSAGRKSAAGPHNNRSQSPHVASALYSTSRPHTRTRVQRPYEWKRPQSGFRNDCYYYRQIPVVTTDRQLAQSQTQRNQRKRLLVPAASILHPRIVVKLLIITYSIRNTHTPFTAESTQNPPPPLALIRQLRVVYILIVRLYNL